MMRMVSHPHFPPHLPLPYTMKRARDAPSYLSEYFRSRNMLQDATCASGELAHERAKAAREEFKRIRLLDQEPVTGGEKYERRLANNRYSAAASRVYREVHRKESAYILKQVCNRAEKFSEEIAQLKLNAQKQVEENALLRRKLAHFQASPPSPVDVGFSRHQQRVDKSCESLKQAGLKREQDAAIQSDDERRSQPAEAVIDVLKAQSEEEEEVVAPIVALHTYKQKSCEEEESTPLTVGVLESPRNLRYSMEIGDVSNLRFSFQSQDFKLD